MNLFASLLLSSALTLTFITVQAADSGQTFAKISGNVKEDVNADDIGDVDIADVLIQLRDVSSNGYTQISTTLINADGSYIFTEIKAEDYLEGVVVQLRDESSNGSTLIATTLSDANGNYVFTELEPGDYRVTQVNLAGYTDVKDIDGGNKNTIEVNGLTGGTDFNGNDFIDEISGAISGFVSVDTVDGSSPIPGVILKLFDSSNALVTTTTSGTDGGYLFSNVIPGDYRVEEVNLSDDYQVVSTDEFDSLDGNKVEYNNIYVKVNSNEIDAGNDFVDKLKPTFCKDVAGSGCSLCAPYRSLDYCDPSESFPNLIQNRTSELRNNSSGLVGDGYWFHYLQDKIAGYLLTVDQGLPAPKVHCCLTNVTELFNCLNSAVPDDVDGVVIKATNFHSNQGVYVLVNNPNTDGEPALDFNLLDNMTMTYEDVISSLFHMEATKIIVEEFIGTSLPSEYKFHVINGSVAAIDIIDARGTDCACYAVVDTDWNRLDKFGCFEHGGFDKLDDNTNCTVIDFLTGEQRSGPVKKDLYVCEVIPELDPCVLQEMIDIAVGLGDRIGVYMRVDMFVVNNTFYVQEYSANHMNGLRHCAAKFDEDGCIDSCFLGRMWDAAGAPYGGVVTAVPDKLDNFAALTAEEQCDLLDGVVGPTYTSTCAEVGSG